MTISQLAGLGVVLAFVLLLVAVLMDDQPAESERELHMRMFDRKNRRTK